MAHVPVSATVSNAESSASSTTTTTTASQQPPPTSSSVSHSVIFTAFVRQNSICFIQCFDIVGWATGRVSGV